MAIAVILPTVCLLWFMSRAVKNERLAIKQKLTDVYKQRLETLSNTFNDVWLSRIGILEQQAMTKRQPIEVFERLVGRDETGGSRICDAIIIFDSNGRLLYPITGDGGPPAEFSDEFNEAWDFEFTEEDIVQALRLYERISNSFVDDYTRYSALMGQVRCLRKLGEIERAVALCKKIAYEQAPENKNSSVTALIARARILLVNLNKQSEEGLAQSDLHNLISSAINYATDSGYGFLPMPSGTRVFLLRKSLEIAEESKWAEELKPQVLKAKDLLSAEALAASALDKYYTASATEPWSEEDALKMVSLLRATLDTIEEFQWSWTEQLQQQISTVLDSYRAGKVAAAATFDQPAFATTFGSWSEDSLRKLSLPEDVFGMYHTIGAKTYLLLQKADRFNLDFDVCRDALNEAGVSYRVTDNSGKHICGLESPKSAAFYKAPLGKFFPGWYVEIHFTNSDIFERAAGRQAVIYMWTGLLAIAVIIAAGLLAVQVVGKQIKANKLKNDFIATVSHELKTPLASMRVLVDTLLEGNVKGQQQVTEYLQLVSKENERLSRLIDNFLTFSRMERNKQAFEILRTHPAAIARAAAEAVKTKLSKGRCRFEVEINEDLPEVLADRDAVVTVLVNLLDNAYKYSYDDKYIELRVFRENDSVCFRVSDNGIGMSRRAVRKIFTRFYQVDRSLTRRVEGCGLGLSIAKFIVDAHKGSISADSKTGQGSSFTIRLPVVN